MGPKNWNLADSLADQGVDTQPPQARILHCYIQKRAQDYTNLVARIQRFILAIIREDQHYRETNPETRKIAHTVTPTVDIRKALAWPPPQSTRTRLSHKAKPKTTTI